MCREFDGFAIKETDAPMGLYIVDEQSKTKVITSVTIEPFLSGNQIKRGENDAEPVPSTTYLYTEGEKLSSVSPKDKLPLIPLPVKIQSTKDSFSIKPVYRLDLNSLNITRRCYCLLKEAKLRFPT